MLATLWIVLCIGFSAADTFYGPPTSRQFLKTFFHSQLS